MTSEALVHLRIINGIKYEVYELEGYEHIPCPECQQNKQAFDDMLQAIAEREASTYQVIEYEKCPSCDKWHMTEESEICVAANEQMALSHYLEKYKEIRI